jgi:hypothetical protein
MKHRASPRFWRCYQKLPDDIRRSADESYRLLLQNPRHPSLHFKRIGRFWSVRVGLHHRALAVQDEAEVVWFWIGPHAEYDGIVGAS